MKKRLLSVMAVFAVLFALNVFLAYQEKVFVNEFSGESDEPAHFISGLLVHDYIQQGFPGTPFEFAKNYYLHYPKVAIGHWPPVFYVIEAFWMLIFGISRVSVFCMMAAISAAIGAGIAGAIKSFTSAWLGVTMGAIFCLTPLVRSYMGTLMVDLAVAGFGLWAMWCFARYLKTGREGYIYGVAILLSLDTLSKGTGYSALSIPFLAPVLAQRWDVYRKRAFWLSLLLAAVISSPWTYLTRGLVLPTFQYEFGLKFISRATWFYGSNLILIPGVLISALALVGFYVKALVPLRKGLEPLWASSSALMAGVLVFHILVPGGTERRYLITALTGLLLFAAAGMAVIAEKMPLPEWFPRSAAIPALATAAALVFLFTRFELVPKRAHGFGRIADDLVAEVKGKNVAILCSSEFIGEGLLVTEMALRDTARPSYLIMRASRMLADSDWNGGNYGLRVKPNVAAVQEVLDQIPISIIVLDRTPGRPTAHHRLIMKVVEDQNRWTLLHSYAPPASAKTAGVVDVYRMNPFAENVEAHLSVELNPSPRVVVKAVKNR